jgi:hypothetical protein
MRLDPQEPVWVTSPSESVSLDYYLKRYGSSLNPVRFKLQGGEAGSTSGGWFVQSVFGDLAREARFYHLRIERLGGGPLPEQFQAMSSALNEDGQLMLGDCPPPLLGLGWSHVEAWSPAFKIRWIIRRRTSIWFPVQGSGGGHLSIMAMPYAYEGAPPQMIAPQIGETLLEQRTLPPGEMSVMEWEIPEGIMERGLNQIQWVMAWTHSPSKEQVNYMDFRDLAAAVHWIQWHPIDD